MNINFKVLIVFLFFHVVVLGQNEVITPLRINKQLQNKPSIANNQKIAVANIDLPFVDDFSGSGFYPDQTKWQDQKVYVNNTFCINPITIGVATFDGLDEFGNPYNNSFSNAQGGCDTLTSQPINLYTKPLGGNYGLSDSIVLSFYYQKKGLGDAPEITDSLI